MFVLHFITILTVFLRIKTKLCMYIDAILPNNILKLTVNYYFKYNSLHKYLLNAHYGNFDP